MRRLTPAIALLVGFSLAPASGTPPVADGSPQSAFSSQALSLPSGFARNLLNKFPQARRDWVRHLIPRLLLQLHPVYRGRAHKEWSEEKIVSLTEHIGYALGLNRDTTLTRGPQLYYGGQRMSFSRWSEGNRPRLVQVGPLFFIDEAFYKDRLSFELKSDLGPNAILIHDMPSRYIGNDVLIGDALPPIAHLLHIDLDGKVVVNLFSGDGAVALAAFKLGAERLELIPNDKHRNLDRIIEDLQVNGWAEGPAIHVQRKQNANIKLVYNRLHAISSPIVFIAIVQTNRDKTYPVRMDMLMPWLGEIPAIKLFIGVGYTLPPVDDQGDWANKKRTLWIDDQTKVVTNYGFHLLSPVVYEHAEELHLGSFAAWAAERVPPGYDRPLETAS